MRIFRSRGLVVGVAVLIWGIESTSYSQSLTWLGSYGEPTQYAEPHGVSSDGSVVSGWAGVYSPHIGWRWTESTGMRSIGFMVDSLDVEAWGMSADGNVIVGYGYIDQDNFRAFVWENDTFTMLPTLGGPTSQAYAASSDGSVVVGASKYINGYNHAFRWTEQGGMQDLGTLGGFRSVARAVSLDGNVITGWQEPYPNIHHAFRWTPDSGMVDIHNPAWSQSEAIGISGDGRVIVGAWGDEYFTPALPFRWTAETGMVNLGTLGGDWGEAWAANYDGSIVVGWSEVAPGQWAAFRWTENGGMENLNVTYDSLLSPGSRLEWASAISPGGRYIVGVGYNSNTERKEAFLLDTGSHAFTCGDVNGSGDVNANDIAYLSNYLFSGGPAPDPIMSGDVNGDCSITVSDIEFLANYLFIGGTAPNCCQ